MLHQHRVLIEQDLVLKTIHKHLGSSIRTVVEKYYNNIVNIEIEYLDILRYIASELCETIHYTTICYTKLHEIEKKLEEIREQKLDKLLVSYFVAKYIATEYGIDIGLDSEKLE